MKSVIVTASVHHGNTRKVVNAIANEFEVNVIDATQVKEKDSILLMVELLRR